MKTVLILIFAFMASCSTKNLQLELEKRQLIEQKNISTISTKMAAQKTKKAFSLYLVERKKEDDGSDATKKIDEIAQKIEESSVEEISDVIETEYDQSHSEVEKSKDNFSPSQYAGVTLLALAATVAGVGAKKIKESNEAREKMLEILNRSYNDYVHPGYYERRIEAPKAHYNIESKDRKSLLKYLHYFEPGAKIDADGTLRDGSNRIVFKIGIEPEAGAVLRSDVYFQVGNDPQMIKDIGDTRVPQAGFSKMQEVSFTKLGVGGPAFVLATVGALLVSESIGLTDEDKSCKGTALCRLLGRLNEIKFKN